MTDERRAISNATTEALRQSGLAHIIAISGLNMALSAGIFFVGFRMLLSLFPGVAQAYPTKKIAAAGALIAVTAYFLISGFAVSAERAFIMMAIMLIAVFFDRPSISLRNVALSALVILVISPSEVLGPSFQMSFAATLALVSGYQLWKDRRVRENAFLKLPIVRPFVAVAGFFGGVFLTSLIGGFSTALFSIEHFHRLTAYGLPANLATMPIISFIIMPGSCLSVWTFCLGRLSDSASIW
ncbi:ComEC/Rec2-related protein [Rhizobium sp. BK226]|nr:ComEC/Rec2-related protein [Rhizobium sp. BK226]